MTEGTRLIDLGFANAFLVKAGDGYLLIDTGIAQQWARLESELLQAGCLPANLKLVIVTHGDPDHAGNCARLQRKYGAKVAMHAGDVAMVKTGAPVKRRIKGILAKVFLGLAERMGGRFDCFEPDVLLEDRQSLAGYGLAAKVLHTPGHTPGSITVLTDDGQLFVGDTLTNRTRPAGASLIENEQELQNSLAILKRTNARVLYPGHGKPFSFEAFAAIT